MAKKRRDPWWKNTLEYYLEPFGTCCGLQIIENIYLPIKYDDPDNWRGKLPSQQAWYSEIKRMTNAIKSRGKCFYLTITDVNKKYFTEVSKALKSNGWKETSVSKSRMGKYYIHTYNRTWK